MITMDEGVIHQELWDHCIRKIESHFSCIKDPAVRIDISSRCLRIVKALRREYQKLYTELGPIGLEILRFAADITQTGTGQMLRATVITPEGRAGYEEMMNMMPRTDKEMANMMNEWIELQQKRNTED